MNQMPSNETPMKTRKLGASIIVSLERPQILSVSCSRSACGMPIAKDTNQINDMVA